MCGFETARLPSAQITRDYPCATNASISSSVILHLPSTVLCLKLKIPRRIYSLHPHSISTSHAQHFLHYHPVSTPSRGSHCRDVVTNFQVDSRGSICLGTRSIKESRLGGWTWNRMKCWDARYVFSKCCYHVSFPSLLPQNVRPSAPGEGTV